MTGREKYVLVALNRDGIAEIDRGGLGSDNVTESVIPEEEFDFFYRSGVLDEVNETFDTMLDYYEEDWIGDNLSLLVGLVEPIRWGCPIIYESVKKAEELNTGVFFNF